MSRGPEPYRVRLTRAAERGLEGLSRKDRERLVSRMAGLADAPRPHGVEKIQGQHELYRIRSGDYRVVYRIDDSQRSVVIEAIGHRRDIYRGL